MYPYTYPAEPISSVNNDDYPSTKKRAAMKKDILRAIADMNKDGNSNDEIIRRNILKTAKIF